MQHANLPSTTTELPVTNKNLESAAEMEQHIMMNEASTTPITQPINIPPPPETIHGQSETNYSDANTEPLTKTPLVGMPNAWVSVGDTIDCGMIAAEKSHEPIPALGSPSIGELKLPSTPAEKNIPQQKDGHYFLKLLKSEETRLLTMAEQAERDIYALTAAGSTSDEIFGILRSVSGKTRLLVSQKLKQFEGLCHSNLNPTADEKFPTTSEDLQGFWDMVNLQIEHVNSLFKELDSLKANNWQKTKESAAPFVPSGSKMLKRPVVKSGNGVTPPKTSPNAILTAQKREAQRKQLLEMKRKNKNSALNKGGLSSPVEIYVSENFV